jgi:SAM-dependent methyltransferase
MSEENAELFDKHARRYASEVDEAVAFTGIRADFFTRVKADYIDEICQTHFDDIRKLHALDIGCGVGGFHRQLAPRFRSLSGVDVSPASIAEARSAHPSVDYKVYDGTRLPYEDESFDVAFTVCVMHHVNPVNWESFCAEMYRVLKKGGLGLVFEHNPRNPLTMRAVNNCPFDADAVLLKSEKTVSLLGNAGFEDVSARYILSVPAANLLLRRVDQMLGGLPFGAQYYVRAVKA